MQKKLSGHPNIVQFITAASIGKDQSDHGQAEFLLLTELCSGEGESVMTVDWLIVLHTWWIA